MIRTSRLRQPKVFSLSVTTALFERMAYYALAFVLVLYIKSEFNIPDKDAFVLFGVFNALVFLTPALGGYLADNILGIRRTMILGLTIESLGLTLLAVPNEHLFYLALSLVIIGVGFFKVGPTNLLGRCYTRDDPRIDSGFTLYYMAMNIGAVISPIAVGYLQRYFGWHIAFMFGAMALYLSLVAYFFLRNRAVPCEAEVGKRKLAKKTWLMLALGIIAACGISIFLLNYTHLANFSFAFLTSMLLIYFMNEIRKSGRKEKLEIIACLILIFIGFIYFILYFQVFMSMTMFINRSVSHAFFGHDIPTSAFLSLNSFWVVVISPFLVLLYNHLNKKNKDLNITNKFALGIFITSLCFICLYTSTFFPNSNNQVSGLWMVLAVMLYSLGELLVSALGVAMVTKIAPKRIYGVMMGAWFLIASSLGSSVSSLVANLASVPDNVTNGTLVLSIYAKAFFEMGTVGIIAAILVFIAGPYIRKIANLS